MTNKTSRREFLRTSSTLSALGVAGPLGLQLSAATAATAANATGYKALVVVNFSGGHDHLSTVVPYDTASHDRYRQVRASLALPRDALLPLPTALPQAGRAAGLNPALAAVKAAYDARRLAVAAGVGPLLAPSSKADLLAGRVLPPAQLGSHNDQQATWFTLSTSAATGWGGRMGDLLAAGNGTAAGVTTISAAGYAQWLVGSRSSFFSVSEGGVPNSFFSGWSTMERGLLMGGSARRTNLIEQAYVETHESLRDNGSLLSSGVLPESTFPGTPAQNNAAAQLRTVARVIGGAASLGLRRQLFFVELGGFDTHNGQAERHAALMRQFDEALGWFDAAMGQLGMRDQVLLATMSDFGRSYPFNGDGTDHGWASHHMLLGGGVQGGEVYGSLPDMALQGADFLDSGFMIPRVSIEQYGGALARWMGLSATEVREVFPLVGRFDAIALGLGSG